MGHICTVLVTTLIPKAIFIIICLAMHNIISWWVCVNWMFNNSENQISGNIMDKKIKCESFYKVYIYDNYIIKTFCLKLFLPWPLFVNHNFSILALLLLHNINHEKLGNWPCSFNNHWSSWMSNEIASKWNSYVLFMSIIAQCSPIPANTNLRTGLNN